ncbi:DNA mismatch repair endonuclease MutL [Flavihumibacter profundi]|uniref:DNA mismatch repair endonuclease MutL n=1 Tax=Flavihumibacter profundi TaxID=2716883 RepID=UPI001CC7E41C|nr:DNA mismatch repair endonuclease MutL [Flavihumibacter profundi]MBZ5857908.1 DNA mismatch repair endonuclease MutL [Flavihumibacter profundi]
MQLKREKIVADSIQLLPDHIANQIAAGEVIQRPASAVKELLENAVDAGATEIRLIINDAGKALIQVVDNGKGMTEADARLCFERHATSKIRQIDDLFHISTMGFRGEALASVAAVSQVELRTRRPDDEMGTYIEIENSMVVRQEPCATAPGTSIVMKNLFFNVPARRNFLKSNAAEMRHIIDEFIRVSMAFPHLFFSLSHNGQQVFHLDKGSIKQRIVQLLGNPYAAKLVSVQEQTDYLNIQGFVGKPDTAKKTRGDQYFFVNNRFIRSAYLNHAVMQAYHDLIPGDSFPMYVLFIDLNPEQIDVNVHPTKQEIKFEDEKIVYAFVQAAVKHALAQFSITPTLEFDIDAGIQQLDAVSKPFTDEQQSAASNSTLFHTFSKQHQAHFIEKGSGGAGTGFVARADIDKGSELAGLKNWRDFFQPGQNSDSSLTARIDTESTGAFDWDPPRKKWQLLDHGDLLQVQGQFIITPTHQGYLLLHQQYAHERILYERYTAALVGRPMAMQRSLFPATLDVNPADSSLLTDLIPDMALLGYLIEPFGQHCFVIQGTPADIIAGNEKAAIEHLLDQYKHFSSDVKFSRREKLIRSLAAQHAIKPGTLLTQKEMRQLATDLLNCTQPNITVTGNPTFIEFNLDYLNRLFGG